MPYHRLLICLPLFAVVLLGVVSSCHKPQPGSTQRPIVTPPTPPQPTGEDALAARRGPRVDLVRSQPQMRIRIAQSLAQAAIGNSGSIVVGPGTGDLGKARPNTFQAPLRISHDKQGFIITEANGNRVRWALPTLAISANAGRVALDNHPYPGQFELVANRTTAGQYDGSFDVVNRVDMESYLPGVISKELYATWDEKAYRAQAVAARSYALWEMNLPIRKQSHYDLEASQASQAYIGDQASDKARRAVADTAGQVLVFEGRVLPAFYSSSSGGTGQDAVAAWPEKVDDLSPLRGKSHGNWGTQSTKYRWGPIQRDRQSLSKRIAAWGVANKHPVAAMGLLAKVDISASNSAGRPTQMKLTDDAGRVFILKCEDLRMASNFRASGLPAVDPNNLVFSSHAEYRIAGNTVSITGRGFGHGVGMDQFGAQHMASQGQDHRGILGFYYPGAMVQKVY